MFFFLSLSIRQDAKIYREMPSFGFDDDNYDDMGYDYLDFGS